MMDFQTPPPVCDYMVGLLPWVMAGDTLLEPTAGEGNIVDAVRKKYPLAQITAPADFFDLLPGLLNGQLKYPRFDYVVMNPPFTPMITGWKFLQHCMQMSNDIICLLPWVLLINSDYRFKILQKFGLISITHLPRKTFSRKSNNSVSNSRIQSCILQMKSGYQEDTIFKTFEF